MRTKFKTLSYDRVEVTYPDGSTAEFIGQEDRYVRRAGRYGNYHQISMPGGNTVLRPKGVSLIDVVRRWHRATKAAERRHPIPY